jgi:hypothetical protein
MITGIELTLVPGLAEPRLQKQLCKNARRYRRLRRASLTVYALSPEEYFQKRLTPLHVLDILSEANLRYPRYIRIGKQWIKDAASLKKKIAPR